MKKLFALLFFVSTVAFGQSYPSPTYNNLTAVGSFTATGLVTLADHATQAANTIIGNATGSPASPTAVTVTGCDGAAQALQWTNGSGFGCNSNIATSGANANITSLTGLTSPISIGAATLYPTVPTNAALLALSTVTTTVVTRLGFYASGDAPPLLYTASGSACSLNAGAGDNGSQVQSSNGKCWIANFPANGSDVREFGAKGDQATDDSAAITNALNDAPSPIVLPALGFRVASGITVPAGKALQGAAPGNYDVVTDSFPAIIGDLALATIVTVTGGGFTEGVALSNVLVTRAAGAIPTNSVGVSVINSGNTLTLRDVVSMRSYIGFAIGPGASTNLGIHLVRCFTGTIPGYHLQISNTVETTVTDSRFGRNGGTDGNSLGYVNINGATVDTVRFTTTQFNLSGGTATAVIAFTGYAANPNGIISLMHCHIEQWLNLITADSGTSAIRSLRFVGNTVDSGSGSIFYNGAANKLTEMMLVGNRFDGGFTFTLDQQLLSVIDGNHFGGTFLVNAGTQVITGNYFDAAVTLQGATAGTTFSGNQLASTLTNTMTGTVSGISTAELTYNNTSSQSISASTLTTITNWTSAFDLNSNFVASTGVFTAPAPARYLVSGQLLFNGSSLALNNQFQALIQVGGVTVFTGVAVADAAANQIAIPFSTVVSMTAGQTLVLRAFQTSSGAQTLNSSGTANSLSIVQLP